MLNLTKEQLSKLANADDVELQKELEELSVKFRASSKDVVKQLEILFKRRANFKEVDKLSKNAARELLGDIVPTLSEKALAYFACIVLLDKFSDAVGDELADSQIAPFMGSSPKMIELKSKGDA